MKEGVSADEIDGVRELIESDLHLSWGAFARVCLCWAVARASAMLCLSRRASAEVFLTGFLLLTKLGALWPCPGWLSRAPSWALWAQASCARAEHGPPLVTIYGVLTNISYGINQL